MKIAADARRTLADLDTLDGYLLYPAGLTSRRARIAAYAALSLRLSWESIEEIDALLCDALALTIIARHYEESDRCEPVP